MHLTTLQMVSLKESQIDSLMTLLLIFLREMGAGGGSLMIALFTKTYQPAHAGAYAVSSLL